MALPMLTQTELVDEVVDRSGWSRADVKAFLAHLSDVVAENVSAGNRVRVAGVQIEPKLKASRKARMGRNPQTGEAVQIAAQPASVKLKAKIVKPLADAELPSVQSLKRKLNK
jgi:nucleoid DNA-binding protein